MSGSFKEERRLKISRDRFGGRGLFVQDVARFIVGRPFSRNTTELGTDDSWQAPALPLALLQHLGSNALPQDLPGLDRYQPLPVLPYAVDEGRRRRVLLASDMPSPHHTADGIQRSRMLCPRACRGIDSFSHVDFLVHADRTQGLDRAAPDESRRVPGVPEGVASVS